MPDIPTPPRPGSPRRVVVFGGAAVLILAAVYFWHRHTEQVAADAAAAAATADGTALDYQSPGTLLSPITSGAAASAGAGGGSVTTYTAADLLTIIQALDPHATIPPPTTPGIPHRCVCVRAPCPCNSPTTPDTTPPTPTARVLVR